MKVLMLIFLSLTTLAFATRIADTSSGYGGGNGGVNTGYGHEDGMHGGGMTGEGLGGLEGMMGGASNLGKGVLGGVTGGISGIGHMGERALQRMAQQFGILVEDLRHFGRMGIYPLENGGCSCPAKLMGKYGGHQGEHMHGGEEGYNNGMGGGFGGGNSGGFEGGNTGGFGGGNTGGFEGGNSGGYGVGNSGGYDATYSNGGFDPTLHARGSFGEEKGSENQPGTEHKPDLKDKPTPTKQEH